MQWLVEVGLSNALVATALAIVAWTAGKVGRRPAVTHALWLLVLLKLLTPPIFEVALPFAIARTATVDSTARDVPEGQAVASLPTAGLWRPEVQIPPDASEQQNDSSHHIGAPANRLTDAASQPQPPVAVAANSILTAYGSSATVDTMVPAARPPIASEPTHSPVPSEASWWMGWGRLMAVIWLSGLMAWLVVQVTLGLRLRLVLRASDRAPHELSDAAGQIARRMGLRRCPQVRIVARIGSPMLCGLGRGTTILMPAALLRRLGREAQETVLAHELAHYRRGDQWVRLVEAVVTGVYWWFPIVWWARREIELAEEQCCDGHVLEIFAGKSRLYAETLLDIVDLISEPHCRMRPAMSSSIGRRPLMQKRLVDLMRRRCVPATPPLTRRVILVSGMVCLMCHPVIFVTDAPSAAAATSGAGTELMRRTLQELPELPGATQSQPIEASARELSHLFPSPLRTAGERDTWATAISANGRYHLTVSRGYECTLHEVTRNHVRSLTGHRITCVAFAADSAGFITGDLQGAVRLWDAASGEVLHTLTEREGPIYSVCLAPAGEQAVVAGEDGIVEIVSLTTPTDRQVLARLDAPVRCARFSPDGSRVAVATDAWRNTSAAIVAVYDVASRARLLQWEVVRPLGAVDFSSEDRIVTVEWSGRAREWALPELFSIDLPSIAKELVSAGSFSADTRVLEELMHHPVDRF